ncbi:hypothetical protein [Achromobacter sp.]|uniref:hypothetical protein n=1 Tax=Achromobacter sp. TaxID=134375 RepID=UPI0028AA22CB|nr:hypothetical protein [Achromobacter sp.]
MEDKVGRPYATSKAFLHNGSSSVLYSLVASQPYNGRWVCDMSGNAVVSGDTLKVAYQDGAPWALALTRRGAVLEVREVPPTGAKDEGFGPPFCGMNGSLSGDWFAVR